MNNEMTKPAHSVRLRLRNPGSRKSDFRLYTSFALLALLGLQWLFNSPFAQVSHASNKSFIG